MRILRLTGWYWHKWFTKISVEQEGQDDANDESESKSKPKANERANIVLYKCLGSLATPNVGKSGVLTEITDISRWTIRISLTFSEPVIRGVGPLVDATRRRDKYGVLVQLNAVMRIDLLEPLRISV